MRPERAIAFRAERPLIVAPLAPHVLATVHPSSILRAPDDATRHLETQRFIADLKKIAQVLKQEKLAA